MADDERGQGMAALVRKPVSRAGVATVILSHLTISTPFIPAAAWPGSVHR
jgi:hypothetical protein